MPKRKTRKSEYIPPPHEIENKKEGRRTRKTVKSQRSSRSSRYELPPPSWMRVAKRSPLVFVLLGLMQYFLLETDRTLSQEERLLRALGIALVFSLASIPMGYWFERITYNRWLRRQGRMPEPTQPPGDGDAQ